MNCSSSHYFFHKLKHINQQNFFLRKEEEKELCSNLESEREVLVLIVASLPAAHLVLLEQAKVEDNWQVADLATLADALGIY